MEQTGTGPAARHPEQGNPARRAVPSEAQAHQQPQQEARLDRGSHGARPGHATGARPSLGRAKTKSSSKSKPILGDSAHEVVWQEGKVHLYGEFETWHWCRYFHCTEDRLREAIGRVGSDVEALRRELL